MGVRCARAAAGDAHPRAVGDRSRRAITGIVRAKWTANARATEFAVNDLASYDAVDPAGPDSRLATCPQFLGDGVPRDSARAVAPRGHTVTLDGGFEPGTTYEVSYRAANPPVAGLGFAAIRDTASWLKHQPDAAAPVRYAYGFGSSQSGRFLRSFLYEGFNTDEKDRQVFDAVFAHIAGAARINLNERWSTPVASGYDVTAFPFADAALQDPVSGAREGTARERRGSARTRRRCSTRTRRSRYWGGGKAAALVHTNPAGTADSAAGGERARLFHRRHPALTEPASRRKSPPGSSKTTRWTTGGRCARCCWRCTSG